MEIIKIYNGKMKNHIKREVSKIISKVLFVFREKIYNKISTSSSGKSTGRLKKSISIIAEKSETYGKIKRKVYLGNKKAWWGRFFEYGTKGSKPRGSSWTAPGKLPDRGFYSENGRRKRWPLGPNWPGAKKYLKFPINGESVFTKRTRGYSGKFVVKKSIDEIGKIIKDEVGKMVKRINMKTFIKSVRRISI